MYLHEAVKKAKESGRGFIRQSYMTRRESIKETDNTVWFYPTNSIVGVIIVTAHNSEDSITPRWQPNLDDFLADDWCVYG